MDLVTPPPPWPGPSGPEAFKRLSVRTPALGRVMSRHALKPRLGIRSSAAGGLRGSTACLDIQALPRGLKRPIISIP